MLFLQKIFGQPTVLPLFLGQNSRALSKELVKVFQSSPLLNKEETLFVVSSNLSDFTDQVNAAAQAESLCRILAKKKPEDLASAIGEGKIGACAAGAILGVWNFLDGSLQFIELSRHGSEVLPPEHRQVWYGSFSGG